MIARLLLSLVVVAGCAGAEAPPPPPRPAGRATLPPAPKSIPSPNDAVVLGETVEDAILLLEVSLGESFWIEEPPGIGRGVKGKDAAGDVVCLYVDRFPAFKGEASRLATFLPMKVVGVARRQGKRWKTCGRVIGYYPCN